MHSSPAYVFFCVCHSYSDMHDFFNILRLIPVRSTTYVKALDTRLLENLTKNGNRKVQGVPQSQTAALPGHQEEEETDKSKQAQIKQTYEKH